MAQLSSAARKAQEKFPVPAKMTVTLYVNGVERKLTVAPWTTLLDRCGSISISPGRKRVAIMGSAAPAPSWSTGGGSIRASPWRS